MAAKSNSDQVIKQLALLRALVGYLGQQNSAGWWDCTFLDSTGIRFLENVFPKTAQVAALRSTTLAACGVHDRALGKVGTYHLFRLPPAVEDQVEVSSENLKWTEVARALSTRESAMEALQSLSPTGINAPVGPVQIGTEPKLISANSIHELAAHYHSAFHQSIRCYPYFSADPHGR